MINKHQVFLLAHALNSIDLTWPCCSRCCAACEVVVSLATTGELDEILRTHTKNFLGDEIPWVAGHSWWVDNQVDRNFLYQNITEKCELCNNDDL